MDDVWRIPIIPQNDQRERLGYPTQKPEALLEVIVGASSVEGDVVCDPLCGSGTTLAVAMEAGLAEFGDGKKAIELVHEMGKATPVGRILRKQEGKSRYA